MIIGAITPQEAVDDVVREIEQGIGCFRQIGPGEPEPMRMKIEAIVIALENLSEDLRSATIQPRENGL